ncbi:acyltransferase domain-containing protein [Actinomadura barringtoniae]|uniref:Acyltransferase domain-containing protein n=1 Tax=Actinomadura barringtoniae TaxID=1427535 RepID=A0A939P7Q5_9ACTN|nr:type I polyketide synthase [Actinomadura barringtoniae]MBO2447075.1 acyltransferase domain-containing protein [Actinomadura barringtoniae]
MNHMNDVNEMTDDTSTYLAVVGMAGRFPGAADLREFWKGLAEGTESITRFDGNAAYGAVTGADHFDAAFFGYSPREALMLDPQQRVFLECAWEALEHTGYDPATYPGVIGVYGGSGDTGHFGTLRANRDRFPGVSDWQFRLASGADFLTSRVAYKLGLTGPAVTVQTACSTSLVAVHIAGQALLAGECDLALAGGVTVKVPSPVGEVGGDDGVLSSDGTVRAFDAAATGTVGADGAGIVALKRLEDALEDGDHVHAVLLGTAINNDGAAKAGFTTPSVDGQAGAARAALAVAGIDPATVGFVEAHGTGTIVGDPIEVRALAKAYGPNAGTNAGPNAGPNAGTNAGTGPGVGTGPLGTSLLGSVKPNIGHTDAAAGVIGLIKAVLALANELVPPTLHFREPNPMIDFASGPFTVNPVARHWPRQAGEPRRAGVNSLGLGGTNAHVIVEEAPASEIADERRPFQLLPLSARSTQALKAAAARLADDLRHGHASIANAAWTLQTGRRAFAHRAFVVAADRESALAALADRPQAVDAENGVTASDVAFLFPGQGGQHVGMAKELYEHEPVFRAEIDRCAELALPTLGLDLRDVLYPEAYPESTRDDAMTSMRIAQPALFAVEYALARLWQSWGVNPGVVAGHSLGAYAAATIAGVIDVADALHLVLVRGRLLESLPDGAMLAVPLPERDLLPYLTERLSIAAINGPAQCVVAGHALDVMSLRKRLDADGIDGRVLHINAAAHSLLVEPVVAEFERTVARVPLSPPSIPWLSDRTGELVTAEQACDPAYWSGHLRHTVRFNDALATLLRESGGGPLLEVGPGRTLITLARRHPAAAGNATQLVLPSLPHPNEAAGGAEALLNAAGRLWQAGVEIDWPALHDGERRRRTPLPTYPFERKPFRLDAEQHVLEPFEPTLAPEPDPQAQTAEGTEQAVAGAFAAVLGMDGYELGPDDDFFELGGDSLVATQALAMIREATGCELTARAVFQAPTVARLARLIDTELLETERPAS